MTEPFSVSLHAVDLAAVRPGQRVLVLGPGPIRLGIAMFAHAAGAEVVVVGQDDGPRLATAREVCNTATVDLAGADLSAGLRALGQAAPFDAVIEAAGVGAAVQAGLDQLRRGGTLVVAGIHARPAAIDLTRLVRMEQTVHGAYRAPIAGWTRVLAFAARNAAALDRLITHRLPLAAALQGFDLLPAPGGQGHPAPLSAARPAT